MENKESIGKNDKLITLEDPNKKPQLTKKISPDDVFVEMDAAQEENENRVMFCIL